MLKNENKILWHTQPWQQLHACQQQNRLPHALLFVGTQGLGKRQFALTFAEALLCNKPDAPCGQCHACHLVKAQSHPDFLLVEPEQAGQMIKVDQIREIVQFVSGTAQQGGQRVIIVNPANAMNVNAANALLKTLEEPAPNTILILINDQNLRLPATIISRCQKIIFKKPSQEIALNWLRDEMPSANDESLRLLLNLADGAPFKAKEISDNGFFALRQELYQGLHLLSQGQADPLQLSAKLHEQDTLLLLNLMLLWLQDMLRYQVTHGEAELINFDYQHIFAQLAQRFSNEKLLNFLDHIKKIYAHMLSSLNLNRQLLLEELFIRWIQYAR